jgi:hypothetical protein
MSTYSSIQIPMTYERQDRCSTNMGNKVLKVPKYEIFDLSDFYDFYSIKPFWVGDFGAKI